jgi:hypothetical protein
VQQRGSIMGKFCFHEFLFTRAVGNSQNLNLDTRPWQYKAHHFRALVNPLAKPIVCVDDYGAVAQAGDQLIIGPL